MHRHTSVQVSEANAGFTKFKVTTVLVLTTVIAIKVTIGIVQVIITYGVPDSSNVPMMRAIRIVLVV